MTAAEQGRSSFSAALALADVYAARNDADRAFHWLHEAFRRALSELGAVAPYKLREIVRLAPFLKPLHTDPRWDQFLTRLDVQ